MVRSNYCTHGNHQVEPHNRCLVPLYWLNTLLGRRIRVGNQVVEANEQMDPKRQTRGWRGQCAGLKWNEPRAWLLAAFISWVWKFHWACPVDGVGDARRLSIASSLEFSIQKHLWACPSLGLACWRPFCQFLHQFHRVQFLPLVSGCLQASGIVCLSLHNCSYIEPI